MGRGVELLMTMLTFVHPEPDSTFPSTRHPETNAGIPSARNFCIAQMDDRTNEQMGGQLTLATMNRRFCKAVKECAVYEFRRHPVGRKSGWWEKAFIVNEMLEDPECDVVIWLDTDSVLIMRETRYGQAADQIFALFQGRHFVAMNELQAAYGPANMGVFAVRRTDQGRMMMRQYLLSYPEHPRLDAASVKSRWHATEYEQETEPWLIDDQRAFNTLVLPKHRAEITLLPWRILVFDDEHGGSVRMPIWSHSNTDTLWVAHFSGALKDSIDPFLLIVDIAHGNVIDEIDESTALAVLRPLDGHYIDCPPADQPSANGGSWLNATVRIPCKLTSKTVLTATLWHRLGGPQSEAGGSSEHWEEVQNLRARNGWYLHCSFLLEQQIPIYFPPEWPCTHGEWKFQIALDSPELAHNELTESSSRFLTRPAPAG